MQGCRSCDRSHWNEQLDPVASRHSFCLSGVRFDFTCDGHEGHEMISLAILGFRQHSAVLRFLREHSIIDI